MVAINDLNRVTTLYAEIGQIERAIDLLDNDGVITAVTISPPPVNPGLPMLPSTMRVPVMIGTTAIETPAQIIQALRTALQTRLDHLAAEMSQLGVTGVEAAAGQPQAAAQPGAVPPPHGSAPPQPGADPRAQQRPVRPQ
jgi:hypothetical protein